MVSFLYWVNNWHALADASSTWSVTRNTKMLPKDIGHGKLLQCKIWKGNGFQGSLHVESNAWPSCLDCELLSWAKFLALSMETLADHCAEFSFWLSAWRRWLTTVLSSVSGSQHGDAGWPLCWPSARVHCPAAPVALPLHKRHHPAAVCHQHVLCRQHGH